MRNIYFHLDFLARFTRYFRTFVSIYNVSIEAMTQIAKLLNVAMNDLVRLEVLPEIPSPKEAEREREFGKKNYQ